MKVIDFINGFYEHDRGCVIYDTFMRGYCYYFAVILKERFGGTILYASYDGHFIIDIDGEHYDVTGNVTGRFIGLTEDYYEKSIMEGCVWKCQRKG